MQCNDVRTISYKMNSNQLTQYGSFDLSKISIFANLPKYIIIYILEYGEEIRYRTGIYINHFTCHNKLHRTMRYKLLNMIMKEYEDGKYSIALPISKSKYLFICADNFEGRERIYIMTFKYNGKSEIRLLDVIEHYVI
jgi:hypothetical protein